MGRLPLAIIADDGPQEDDSINWCDCEYEIISVTLLTPPPTTGQGDHLETSLFTSKTCPNGDRDFSVQLGGTCTLQPFPATDFFSGYTTNGFVPYNCRVPRFDGPNAVLINFNNWLLGDCTDETDNVTLFGEISLRVRCTDRANPSESCGGSGMTHYSNIFTGQFIGDDFAFGTPIIYMGATGLNSSGNPIYTGGCGCEVKIGSS
ncbi:MAG: hypothetical protein R2788_26525 [Saprospiraceae bacterium]